MAMSRRLKLTKPLAILDLETTGTTPSLDRIVEIAILKVYPDRTNASYHRRVNPEIPIPPEATRVHGIEDDDVKRCPPFTKLAPEISHFLANCDLAGYNLLKFDLPLLQSEFSRSKIAFSCENRRVVDACRIFQLKEPRDLISALKFFCNEQHSDAHSALHDVEACWKILRAQVIHYPDLPLDVHGLHDFCNPRDERFVDGDRKFEWRYNEATIAFGKNRGRSLKETAEQDPGFLEWMLRSDFGPETKEIAENALKGTYPKRPVSTE